MSLKQNSSEMAPSLSVVKTFFSLASPVRGHHWTHYNGVYSLYSKSVKSSNLSHTQHVEVKLKVNLEFKVIPQNVISHSNWMLVQCAGMSCLLQAHMLRIQITSHCCKFMRIWILVDCMQS